MCCLAVSNLCLCFRKSLFLGCRKKNCIFLTFFLTLTTCRGCLADCLKGNHLLYAKKQAAHSSSQDKQKRPSRKHSHMPNIHLPHSRASSVFFFFKAVVKQHQAERKQMQSQTCFQLPSSFESCKINYKQSAS